MEDLSKYLVIIDHINEKTIIELNPNVQDIKAYVVDNHGILDFDCYLMEDFEVNVEDKNWYSHYSEPLTLNRVRQFHKIFKHPILNRPSVAPAERGELRVELLDEELDELDNAIAAGDIIEIADALVDLQYILSGSVIEYGLAEIFGELFEEVHRSNMSKVCKTEEEAEATIDSYIEKNLNLMLTYEKIEEGFIVYRNDGKILKSINYKKPNLKDIIHKRIKEIRNKENINDK